MITTLNPIVTNQILDTINGTSPDINVKKKMIDSNHILSVNGRTAYHAYTDEEYIYYFLRRNSSTKYYYPIAFAKVEITDRPYWEYEQGWDSGGNCLKCGEAGRCHCSHKRRPTPLALYGATLPDNQQVLPADVLVGEGTLPEPPHQ